jgi:hypothetical protein
MRLFVFGTATGLFSAAFNGGFSQVKSWHDPAAAITAIESWPAAN